MREIPVYTAPDGSLTLTPGNSVPVPLHTLPPKRIFDLFMFNSSLMRRHNVTISALSNYPSVHMLYLDDEYPLAALTGTGACGVRYMTPDEAFAYVACNKPLIADTEELKDYFSFVLGDNSTPEEAAENMKRYNQVVSLALEIADTNTNLTVNADPDFSEGRTTSYRVMITSASPEAPIVFSTPAARSKLSQALALCDVAGCIIDEMTGKLCFYFITHSCLTYAQLLELYKKNPYLAPPALESDEAMTEFREYVEKELRA